jgi:hypothetical protein
MAKKQNKENDAPASSGLFRIKHSNRTVKKHWGKNCFNSSFPTAVACYMLANGIPAIYNRLAIIDSKLVVVPSEIHIADVFNSGGLLPDELDFQFESVFAPYKAYSTDNIDGIDLVVRKDSDKTYLSPLEIKLTVLPTSATSKFKEEKWGSELVIRSATTSYCALGMYDSIKDDARTVREIFENTCADVQSWTNDFEMSAKTPALTECVNTFQRTHLDKQKPLLVQVIWKTQGQSHHLADNAFDIVVWSDYAFSRLFLDGSTIAEKKMSRPMRASARLARCIWELSKSGKINLDSIYRQMAFGKQTDKEFAIQGDKWRKYVTADRILKPILPKDVVHEIIEPGFIEKLKPERRFDQTLYFTSDK